MVCGMIVMILAVAICIVTGMGNDALDRSSESEISVSETASQHQDTDYTDGDSTTEAEQRPPPSRERRHSPRRHRAPLISEEDYKMILQILHQPNIPVNERTPTESRLYKKVSSLNLTSGNVFDPYRGGELTRVMRHGLIVLPTPEVQKCLKWYYFQSKGEGARKLYHKVSKHYYGIGEKSIQKYVNAQTSQQLRQPKFKNKAPLKPVRASNILHQHQIDLVDLTSFAKTKKECKNMKYVLSIIDVHSRYLWLRSMKNKKASSVSKIVQSLYDEWGYPKRVQVDQGTEFRGRFQTFCDEAGIKVIRSSPRHPQSQGKDERSHQTWKNKLRFDLQEDTPIKNWRSTLKSYQDIYNHGYHSSIGMSPHDSHFGLKAQPERCQVRQEASRMDKLSAEKMVCRDLSKKPVSVYGLGEEVLVRAVPPKHTRKLKGRTGPKAYKHIIIETDPDAFRYKVKPMDHESTKEERWVPVKNITSLTHDKELGRSKILTKTGANWKLLETTITKSSKSTAAELLLERAALYGLKLHAENPGEGNCMFHAIAQQLRLHGKTATYSDVRQAIVNYLREHTTIQTQSGQLMLEDFVEGPWEDYISRMANDGEWGDHVVLVGASALYQMTIAIISTVSEDPVYVEAPHQSYGTLYIGHIGELHYMSLVPAEETCKFEPHLCSTCGQIVECSDRPNHGCNQALTPLSEPTMCPTCGFYSTHGQEHDCLDESLVVSMGRPHAETDTGADLDDTLEMVSDEQNSESTCRLEEDRALGPIRMFVPEVCFHLLPQELLDGYLAADFEKVKELEEKFPGRAIYCHEFGHCYIIDQLSQQGRDVQKKMHPEVFNLLVDEINFEDNFRSKY